MSRPIPSIALWHTRRGFSRQMSPAPAIRAVPRSPCGCPAAPVGRRVHRETCARLLMDACTGNLGEVCTSRESSEDTFCEGDLLPDGRCREYPLRATSAVAGAAARAMKKGRRPVRSGDIAQHQVGRRDARAIEGVDRQRHRVRGRMASSSCVTPARRRSSRRGRAFAPR